MNTNKSKRYDLNERLKITNKKQKNMYSVDAEYINSIKFHRNIYNIKNNKRVLESIYNSAIKILEDRNGTYYESIIVIDAVTGKEIVYNNKINKKFETSLFEHQKQEVEKCKHKIISIHNHPKNSQLSYMDIRTLMINPKCKMSIAIGHNGTVYVAEKLKQIDIERVYEATYDAMKDRKMKLDGSNVENQVIKILVSKKIIRGGTYYEKK